MRSRMRFIIAIALAVGLGGYLAYASLGGVLRGPGAGLANSSEGLRFTVVDKEDTSKTVQVLYRGSVPDQFKVGREVVLTGKLENGTFVARNDSLVTLCPSKFTETPGDTSPT